MLPMERQLLYQKATFRLANRLWKLPGQINGVYGETISSLRDAVQSSAMI
jgi:hypothetical protein